MLVDLKLILIILFCGPWNVEISTFGTELLRVLLWKSLQTVVYSNTYFSRYYFKIDRNEY